MHDRIRAKPPTTDVEDWTEATVRAVRRTEGGVAITVAPTNASETVEITVTGAIFDLFTGRLEWAVTDPADAVGATVWVK